MLNPLVFYCYNNNNNYYYYYYYYYHYQYHHHYLLLLCFYCATLCVSTIFAVIRCLSVCLSVTLLHCIHIAEDIVELLSRSGSPTILVFFDPEREYPIPRETPSVERSNTPGWGKFAIFD